MIKNENNFAYIDGTNLHRGIFDSGWILDYTRFRVWLAEKYSVRRTYIFIGLIPKYKEFYVYLQEAEFTLIFKEVVYDGDSKLKGNCDADLVLQMARDAYEGKFDEAAIVSSNRDYASLIKFLKGQRKLKTILLPHDKNLYLILLKRIDVPISYLNNQKSIYRLKKKKSPTRTKLRKGLFCKY